MKKKHIKLVVDALENSEVVILNGEPGSGKSTTIMELVPKHLIIDKSILGLHGENIEVLPSDFEITSNSENSTIAIDEAQLFCAEQLLSLVSSAVENKTKVIIGIQKLPFAYLSVLEESLSDSVGIQSVEIKR